MSGSPPLLPLALCTAQYEREGGGATFLQPRRGYTTYAGGQNGEAEWGRGGKENSADSSSSVDFSLVFGPPLGAAP